MRKYLTLYRAKLDEYFAYRLNFLMWRIRSVLGFILLYYVWANIALNKVSVAGYDRSDLFAYIFIGNILNAVVLSSATSSLSGEILNGDIINVLLKPMGFFKYILTREAVDKSINIVCSLIEFLCFYLILQPQIAFQVTSLSLLAFTVSLVFAMGISFFISLSLSFIAFWSSEVWAPRFIFFILISLVAGTMFPLDILPKGLFNLFMLTPFPYLVYVPANILVFGITADTFRYLITSALWFAGSGVVMLSIWKKGIREFSFFGR